jgi:anthranilate phosphoribosyltransferase
MREILNYLFEYKRLTTQEAEDILIEIAGGKHSDSEIAALITVFNMRTISIDELAGFRNALLSTCLPIDLSGFNTIDLCGTGGDGKNTFNISTLSALVAAGAGAIVAKHGNYAASSGCGSSNVMEYLGYKFSNNRDRLCKELNNCGITFLHAPLFNPAMKNVSPVRRALRLRTFFNMLGPMVNPGRPQNQIIGVYSLELARMYNYLYQKSNVNYCIIHSLDGYDEISLTGDFKILTNKTDRILSPEDFGMPLLKPEELGGSGDVPGTSSIFMNVLEGKGTNAQNAVVIANAGMALATYFTGRGIETCLNDAKSALLGGKALKIFKKLISMQ